MNDIVERLNNLSDDLVRLDLDMKLPAGSVDPREGAESIQALRKALGESRCPCPVDDNETVKKCMQAGWCGCDIAPLIEPGYEPHGVLPIQAPKTSAHSPQENDHE